MRIGNSLSKKKLLRSMLKEDFATVKEIIKKKINDPEFLNDLYLYDKQHIASTLLSWSIENKQHDIALTLLSCPQINVNTSGNILYKVLKSSGEGREKVFAALLQRPDINPDERDSRNDTPFTDACRLGDIKIVNLLLAHPRTNRNAANNDKWTGLHWAVERSNFEIIELLANRLDIDINARIQYGWTALMLAIHHENYRAAEILIKNPRYDFTLKDGQNKNILNYALAANDSRFLPLVAPYIKEDFPIDQPTYQKLASALINAVMRNDVNYVRSLLAFPRFLINAADEEGNVALITAIKKNHMDMIRLLLDDPRIDINLTSNNESALTCALQNGMTDLACEIMARRDFKPERIRAKSGTIMPLHSYLAQFGDITQLALLLQHHKVDINEIDSNGLTILDIAISTGRLHIANLILQHYPNAAAYGNKHIDTPLIAAVHARNHAIVTALINDNKVDVDDVNNAGMNALMSAAQMPPVLPDQLHIFKLLLAKTKNINHVDHTGKSALHHALAAACIGNAELLVHDVRMRLTDADASGKTPVMYAVANGYHQLAIDMIMLDHSIAHAPVNAAGDSLLIHFINNKFPQETQTLLDCKWMDLHYQSLDGTTALTAAVKTGRSYLVKLLLAKDVNLNQADSEGMTALHWAVALGDEAIAREILQVNHEIVNLQDNSGNTPINIAAAKFDDANMVKTLLAFGADPLIENKSKKFNAIETAMAARHEGLLYSLQHPEQFRVNVTPAAPEVYIHPPQPSAPPDDDQKPSAPPLETDELQTFSLFRPAEKTVDNTNQASASSTRMRNSDNSP